MKQMSSWQGALTLFRSEMSRSWIGILVTMAFFTYIAFVMMLVIGEMIGDPATGMKREPFVDFMFVTILPNMGFVMSKSVFGYWRTNPHTRKIAYWRTMPISFDVIVIARMLQLVAVLAIVGIYYFTIQYLMVRELRELLTIGEYMLYALPWLGYSLLVGSLYMFAEQTVNGRTYLLICVGCVIFYALLIAGFWQLHFNPVAQTLQWAQAKNGIPTLVMLVSGGVALLTVGHVLRDLLKKRNLLND